MIAGGFMTAGLSLFYYPVVFGAVGVVWGILVSKNDFRKGRGLILSSLIFMGLGLFAKEFWSI